MKFYDVPVRERNLILDFAEVEVSLKTASGFEIFDEDILEASFESVKEQNGGIVNSGLVVLDNTNGRYGLFADSSLKAGLKVEVWFKVKKTGFCIKRFVLYADCDGFAAEAEEDKRTCRIKLNDFSYRLKRSNLYNDWSSNAHAVHCAVCDAGKPEKSLVHILASRGGMDLLKVASCALDYEVLYVTFSMSVWEELCLLAKAYRAHLECTAENDLEFIESAYSKDELNAKKNNGKAVLDRIFESENLWELGADELSKIRIKDDGDDYWNTVRIRQTRYSSTEKIRLWKYSDEPVFFDENFEAQYLFGTYKRAIQIDENYIAPFYAFDKDGKILDVVYTEDVDTLEEFESRIVCTGDVWAIVYDTSTYKDCAIVQLYVPNECVLSKCEIWGRAIVALDNWAHYINDDAGVLKNGTVAHNISNKYLSESPVEGEPFYSVWANDELEKGLKHFVSVEGVTNTALFAARVGAKLAVNTDGILIRQNGKSYKCGRLEVKLERLALRYAKNRAFECAFWGIAEIKEEYD